MDIKLLSKLISICTVTKVDYKDGTVRVDMKERGVISGSLQVLQRRTKENKSYDMPEVGEEVLCLFLPQDNFITGFVIGGIYNNVDTTNLKDSNKGIKSYRWADGSFVKYNENTKKMEVNSVGEVEVTSGTVVNINCETLNMNASGDINISTKGTLSVSASTSIFDNIIHSEDMITNVGSYNLHRHNITSSPTTTTNK